MNCVESVQDLIDLDSEGGIKPVFARKFYHALTAWKHDNGKVPRTLLSTGAQTDSSSSSSSSPAVKTIGPAV